MAQLFVWHIVTVLLLVLAVAFCGALGALHRDAVLVGAVFAATISLVSIAVTTKAGIAFYRFPASYLLGATAILAFAGAL